MTRLTSIPTRPRSRALVMTAAVAVALISTGSAYLAMVSFGVDVLAMDAATAYATAGVFELSLVTVALLAREAAKDNRPGGTLLTLTWALSSASGAFAAWHEIFIGHPLGAGIFRFLVPLLAALMWHLALIGDRHLATGMSWSGIRQARRMHALFLTTEDLFRAQSLTDGSRAARRRVTRAEAARRRARAVALRTVPPSEMRAQVATWCEALSAVGDGTADVARLHVADRAHLSGATETATVPAHERRAAAAVASELHAITETTVVDAAPEPVPADEPTAEPAPVVDETDTPVSAEIPPVPADEPTAEPAPVVDETDTAPVMGPRRTAPETIERIRALRGEGRKVRDVATLVGVSPATVSRYAPGTGSIPAVAAAAK